jgi:microcystin-dependent protein
MDFYIGTLMPFPYNRVPDSWIACNGQLLQIAHYTALFALFGTTYGGDGRITFGVPLLNTGPNNTVTRVVMGQGNGPGLTPRVVGEMVGTDTVTLDGTQMPAHAHSFNMPAAATGQTPVTAPPTNGVLIDQNAGVFVASNINSTVLGTQTIMPAGNGVPHANSQPWLALRWCVATTGVFPSRP